MARVPYHPKTSAANGILVSVGRGASALPPESAASGAELGVMGGSLPPNKGGLERAAVCWRPGVPGAAARFWFAESAHLRAKALQFPKIGRNRQAASRLEGFSPSWMVRIEFDQAGPPATTIPLPNPRLRTGPPRAHQR